MTHKRIAAIIAGGFFIFWLAILYAGADHPTPPGFVLIIVIDLVSACVVYFRVPTYIDWFQTQGKHGLWRALLDGIAAGLVIALVMMLSPFGGEPSIETTLTSNAIWLAVLGGVGAVNAVSIYGISALFARRATK